MFIYAAEMDIWSKFHLRTKFSASSA